jgi:hypothetical protein
MLLQLLFVPNHALTHFNPFRSYIGPRPAVLFSSSAPMSEDVRRGFLLRLFAHCRSLSDSFPHVVRTLANR